MDFTKRLSELKKLLQESQVREAQFKIAGIKLQGQIELLEEIIKIEQEKGKKKDESPIDHSK